MDHYDPTALAELRFAAMTFEDLQKLRVGTGNRAGAARRNVALLDPDAAAAIAAGLQAAEDAARRMLRRTYRQVTSPAVRHWQERTHGVGDHLMALLLSEIGDPFVAVPVDYERQPTGDPYERTLADLWGYCGYVPGRRRTRGITEAEARACGSVAAKRHCYLLATQQVRLHGPFRELYDAERIKAKEKVDAKGEPWTEGHAHAHALRVVAKALLKDLWRVRRDEYRAEGAS